MSGRVHPRRPTYPAGSGGAEECHEPTPEGASPTTLSPCAITPSEARDDPFGQLRSPPGRWFLQPCLRRHCAGDRSGQGHLLVPGFVAIAR